jgi:hypothetical protein
MKPSAFITVFLAGVCAVGAGYQFPSDGVSKSPNAKWKVVCKSPANDNPDSGHRLFLVSTDGSGRELRHFDRHCDVLWSADSLHVAVTDWLGSNLSDIFIYTVTNSQAGISLGDLSPKDALPQAETRGHCYYEAMKWLDDHHLQIRVFGHTDEARSHDFEYSYIFDLSLRRFQRLTTKTPNKSLQATRDDQSSSASRFNLAGPACLSSGRSAIRPHE